MSNTTQSISPLELAHFRFGVIAPVLQGTFSDASEAAYFRRICEHPLKLPNGNTHLYSPDTLAKWASLYRSQGMDGLVPSERRDKGISRVLSREAIEEIFRLREKFPRINGVMIHESLLRDGFIGPDVSVRAIQRFLKANDLKSARDPNVKKRMAFEMANFGEMWQADSAYLPYIKRDGKPHRTFLIMIIDDHSRMIVGGEIFFNDNAYNFQKVLKDAISTYGLPDKLYSDHGSVYENGQLTFILDSLGIRESHAPVRDGSAKGKCERNFRTVRSRFLATIDPQQIESLEQFNSLLRDYIRKHNTRLHSGIKETPMDRYLRTREYIRLPESKAWLDQCFLNRITRKVRHDACVSIDSIEYDCPPRFMGMKVDIRFLPDHMEDAFILYEGEKFPIKRTDRIENAHTWRGRPSIDYGHGAASSEEGEDDAV